jgi:hypothetical protein
MLLNTREASVGFDYDAIDEAENPDAPRRKQEEPALSRADLLEFARRLVSYIRGKDRCRLTVDCLHLALGDADLLAATMTSVAKQHGVTKAAISKRTKEIREELHLSINANNKSPHASHRYRETNQSPVRLTEPS